MSKRLSVIVLAAFVLITLAGCSKPPEMEMQAANAAFDAARTAEAEQYVADSYRAAMDSLNAANAMKQEQDAKFALFRSYGKSKALFVKAEAMAKQVGIDAAAEKERVKAQVTELMAQVRTALDAAKTAIDKAPKGKGSKADIEMFKNDHAAAEAGYTDAMNDFNAGKYLVAKSKLEAVNEKAKKIEEDIALATAKKTGKK
ncbi:MAG: hypothetical protein NTW14_14060 [bacterium]|nr:hypothetical protein [bacterium]